MNKNIIRLLPLLVLCYSCLPIASPPSGSNQTKVQLSGDFSNADSIEVTVKDIDCVPAKPCTTNKFTIDPKSGNNFVNVTSGNKQITVVQIKNGKAISQNRYTKNILNDGNVVVVTASISPTATPTISINPTAIPSSEVSPAPTVAPSENPSSSPTINPIPMVTPSPTATPRSSGGNVGGGGSSGGGGAGIVTNPTPPPIQASATIAPDVTSVK